MKFVIALCILVVVGAASFKPELDQPWEKFKVTYGKKYGTQEEEARRLIWEQNVAIITEHNLEYDLGKHTYNLGINENADLSHQEFLSIKNGLKRSDKAADVLFTFSPPTNVVLPDTVDWRTKGLVTPVKQQGICGSCWAFSATGAVEGQHKKKTGKLVSLSEQNLVDCSYKQGNLGCTGGFPHDAFQYIIDNHGIATEESYPYRGEDGPCRFNESVVGATIKSFVFIKPGSENDLQLATATVGPISVGIDARSPGFGLYRSGIYNNPNCSQEVGHAVLVVGYGSENGQDYWLVKNSFGMTWGAKGYIKMSRNKNNQCGIANKASYPLV